MTLIGAHISVAGGLSLAYERADAVGCESMQIFTRNQRQWLNKSLSFQEIEDLLDENQKSAGTRVNIRIPFTGKDPAVARA